LAAEKGKFFLLSGTVIWPIDRANGRIDPSLTRHALMVLLAKQGAIDA
jgi:hypothetical protein